MSPPVTDYTKLTKFEQYYAFAAVSSLFFIWGLSYGLLDVLNSHFYQIFELTKTMTTMLQFAYFISYLIVAPPMGIFMRRYGYKLGIHIGLGLFSTGAILYWPAAHYHLYPMFVAFTFVTASGLATLEVAASSYLTVLGPAKYSALRLTLAQSTNGIATVIGPLIAAYTFFNGENSRELGTVQYVYLAMSLFGVVVNIAIYFSKLPEIQQAMTPAEIEAAGYEKPTLRGLFKFKRTIFGALAEFAYASLLSVTGFRSRADRQVGAQVGLASFTIFYITEQPGISPPYPKSDASSMFSGCQAVFTIARFLGVWYLKYIDPSFALFANGVMLMLFSVLTAVVNGKGGIACLFLTFFFEGICYPVIFAVATENLGQYNKLGSGLIAAAVCGGACWPAMTGAVADAVSTQRSMFIIFMGYVPLAAYGGGMWVSNSNARHGRLSIWQYKDTTTPVVPEEASTPDVVLDDEKRVEEKAEFVHKA